MTWQQEELDALVEETKVDEDNVMPGPKEQPWPVMITVSRTFCLPVTAPTPEEAVELVKATPSEYQCVLGTEVIAQDTYRVPEEWEMVLHEDAIAQRMAEG